MENKEESDHFLQILENLEILETVEGSECFGGGQHTGKRRNFL